MKKYAKIITPFIALTAIIIVSWPEPQSYIPEKLWGVWETDHAPYADRYLDIGEAIFTLGQGPEALQVLFVQRVETTPKGDGQESFTLYYRDHVEPRMPLQTFTFTFRQGKHGGRIVLHHQKSIPWYRNAETAPIRADTQGDAP